MFKSGCFFLPTDGKNTEPLLSAPEGVCIGKQEEWEADAGPTATELRATASGPECLYRFPTDHIHWRLESGNGHNQHIYHPKGPAVHKFNPAKELENKIDDYKEPGREGGLSEHPSAARRL